MLGYLLLSLFVALGSGTPTITAVDSLPWTTLQTTPPAIPTNGRIVWRWFTASLTAAQITDNLTPADPFQDILIVDGINLNANLQAKIVPNNKLCSTPVGVTAPLGGVNGDPVALGAYTEFSGSSTRRGFHLPNAVPFYHSHTMPWICLSTDAGVTWVNTTLLLGVSEPCATSDPFLCPTIAAAALPNAANLETITDTQFLERRNRTACCGFRGRIDANLRARFGVCYNPNINSCCGDTATTPVRGVGKPFNKFSEKCCYKGNWTAAAGAIIVNAAPAAPSLPVTRTAGEQPYVMGLDTPCPCTTARVNDYCNDQLPNDGVNNLCCTPTKYPELVSTTQWGQCYDGNRRKCCNTGELYDPGTYQCCAVSGIQAVASLCPCSMDSHCGLNQTCCAQWQPRPLQTSLTDTVPSRQRCSPYLNYPTGGGTVAAPAADGANPACFGRCMDKRFHICCNGVVCINGIEKCCNATCCNRFTQHCTPAGLWTPSNPNNFREFRIGKDVCTTKEALTPTRAILAFLIPIVLLTAIFVCFAISFFFARRVNALTPLTAYQKAMFAIATLAVIFTLPLIFAGTLYKYALIVMWASFFTIIVSMSPYPPLYVVAALVQAVILIYFIDPFYGNELLTLSHSKPAPTEFIGNSGVGFNGILHSINAIWLTRTQPLNGRWSEDGVRCTALYAYWFTRDEAVEDRARWDNPAKPTYGYCSRDYGMILYIFSGLSIILYYFLFFLTIITHFRNVLISKADRLGGAILDVDVPAYN